jgi:TldD protein
MVDENAAGEFIMIDPDICREVLDKALSRGGSYGELFVEEREGTSVEMKDGKIRSLSRGSLHGVGLRVLYGNNFVYAYGNDFARAGLNELADAVSQGVKGQRDATVADLSRVQEDRGILKPRILPEEIPLDSKVKLLFQADAAARDYSPLVSQVTVNYNDSAQHILIASSDGRIVEDRRVRTRFVVGAVAEKGDKKETGYYAPGKGLGFEFFERFSPKSVAEEAARIAVVLLDADFAPTGKLPVVIDNGFGGVILHEAVGHALEATSVADNASVFTGKLGEKIANECITAVDDGTLPNEWGSSDWDDEGHPTQRNVLIEEGILRSYMVDTLGSIKMGLPVTGNGRRESYTYAPTSRMTNTFFVPGPHTLEDLIGSVDHGIYCKNMGGGSVNPPTTDFNFAVTEAYLIKGGKLDRPLKGAALIGRGSDIIKQIDMVADNLDFGTGMCGSRSGSVPANVGQPAVRVSGLVVGGREEKGNG